MKMPLRYKILSLIFFFSLPSFAQTEGFAISTDGSPIHYKTFGTAKPLLIINGGPGMNSEGFTGLATILSKQNQTIIYDQRGTGRYVLAKTDSSTITMQLMIADIESLRKYLKIDKWIVLGHSFGGMVASYYATQYPERIDKLILSSSGGIDLGLLNYASQSINGRLTKTELDAVSYWTSKISNGDTSHYAKLQRGLNLAPAYVYDRKFIPIIAERLTQGNPTINQLVWNDLQKIHFNCFEKLKGFTQPVLIIQGKEDIVTPETAQRSHAAFSNSRIVYIDHSVHYAWLDNPGDYFRVVEGFLEEK